MNGNDRKIFNSWKSFLAENTWPDTISVPDHLDREKMEQSWKAFLKEGGFSVLRELGRGAFGVVYEVQRNASGQRLAAKVVKDSNRETENYEFAMKNKSSMPTQYAKYLPDVKEIVPGPDNHNIIFMELLKPLPKKVAQELFASEDAPDESQKTEKILKSPEATAELVQRVVDNNRILNQMREFLVNRQKVTKAAVNAATKSPHSDAESLLRVVYGAVVQELEFQSTGVYEAFEKALKNDMLFYLDKQVVPVHQPEPDDPDIDDLWTGPAMPKTQELFPEAQNLINAMRFFMQDQNWRPKDVHIKNVMMRPGTNDFVIVDLGLFQRGIFEAIVRATQLILEDVEGWAAPNVDEEDRDESGSQAIEWEDRYEDEGTPWDRQDKTEREAFRDRRDDLQRDFGIADSTLPSRRRGTLEDTLEDARTDLQGSMRWNRQGRGEFTEKEESWMQANPQFDPRLSDDELADQHGMVRVPGIENTPLPSEHGSGFWAGVNRTINPWSSYRTDQRRADRVQRRHDYSQAYSDASTAARNLADATQTVTTGLEPAKQATADIRNAYPSFRPDRAAYNADAANNMSQGLLGQAPSSTNAQPSPDSTSSPTVYGPGRVTPYGGSTTGAPRTNLTPDEYHSAMGFHEFSPEAAQFLADQSILARPMEETGPAARAYQQAQQRQDAWRTGQGGVYGTEQGFTPLQSQENYLDYGRYMQDLGPFAYTGQSQPWPELTGPNINIDASTMPMPAGWTPPPPDGDWRAQRMDIHTVPQQFNDPLQGLDPRYNPYYNTNTGQGRLPGGARRQSDLNLREQLDVWSEHANKEILNESIDLSSFKINDHLEPNVWAPSKVLLPQVRERLIMIAKQFWVGLDLPTVEIDDITFTGSLANFNWSQYSDVDLHILVDFNLLPGDEEITQAMMNSKRAAWNRRHNIEINGYEVEIYVQDSNEPHHSTGVYSVLHDQWIVEPFRKDFTVDSASVTLKANHIMTQIDKIEEQFQEQEYKKAMDNVGRLKEKIQKFRKCGLEENGEYSSENITFKVLRRNGYLEKLSNLKVDSYDKLMSF